MAERDNPEVLATAMAHMVQDLLAQDSVQSTLDRICRHATTVVEGCESAGVMMLHRARHVETLAVTDDLVDKSDQLQGELGEGPCFDAIQNAESVYRVADMAGSGPRWPDFGPKARALGVGSMLGFLLATDDDYLGALNMYSTEPNAFTAQSEHIGWIFASHAAVACSTARSDEQLREAISTRQMIGEAMGIAMERYQVTEDGAFDMLRKLSQEQNVKLRNIARQVIETA